MPYLIDQAIDSFTVDAIAAQLNQEANLEDGKRTAGGLAKSVKDNQQAKADLPQVVAARKIIEQALRKHEVFRAAALPLRFAKTTFSRYEPGMHYGRHVDEPFIQGIRTDLSFTLFLSDESSYDGGELVISRPDGDEEIKAPKGSLYLYPSSSVHYVKPVTQGVRLVAVGWVQSRVRLDEKREILFDLSRAIRQLPREATDPELKLLLLKSRNNLLRLWGE